MLIELSLDEENRDVTCNITCLVQYNSCNELYSNYRTKTQRIEKARVLTLTPAISSQSNWILDY